MNTTNGHKLYYTDVNIQINKEFDSEKINRISKQHS